MLKRMSFFSFKLQQNNFDRKSKFEQILPVNIPHDWVTDITFFTKQEKRVKKDKPQQIFIPI